MKSSGIPFAKLPARVQKLVLAQDAKPVVPTPNLDRMIRQSSGKRIRQSNGPKMNQLETEFLGHLRMTLPEGTVIRPQDKSYRLANGINYRPDFTAIIDGVENAWETKGPKAFRGGFENLKFAADKYREIKWTLAWKDLVSREWRYQFILADV